MKVVIIKYNAGNIQSVLFALERLGVHAIVSDDPHIIRSADKLIFPGVGEASSAMQYMEERGLDQLVKNAAQPVLGICLGMQLLCKFSEEGNTRCIGLFDHTVKKFTGNAKVPQIGWNNIYGTQPSLFKGIEENAFVYFVHSYYAALGPDTAATTDHIIPFSSALEKDNFYGVQFHPEKSSSAGVAFIHAFLKEMLG